MEGKKKRAIQQLVVKNEVCNQQQVPWDWMKEILNFFFNCFVISTPWGSAVW